MLEAESQLRSNEGDHTQEIFDQARWMNRFSRKKKQLTHPSKRFNHGSVTHQGYLYIMGGANTNT